MENFSIESSIWKTVSQKLWFIYTIIVLTEINTAEIYITGINLAKDAY